MSEEIKLPELPTSQMLVDVWDSQARGLHQANAAYYAADQMREYGRQCAEAARNEERQAGTKARARLFEEAIEAARKEEREAIRQMLRGHELFEILWSLRMIDEAIRARGEA